MAYINRFYVDMKNKTKAERRVEKQDRIFRHAIKVSNWHTHLWMIDNFGKSTMSNTEIDEALYGDFYYREDPLDPWSLRCIRWNIRRNIEVNCAREKSWSRYHDRLVKIYERVWGEEWPDIGRMHRFKFRKLIKKLSKGD